MTVDPMSPRVQLVLLKAHVTLMSKGMRHSRISPTKMLSLVSAITGKRYKRGAFAAALADINHLLETA